MPEPALPKTCPRCQSHVPADAPGGLCPKCLLEFVAQSTAGAETFQSDRDVPDLDTMRQAFPQLEIQGLIGQGGMGAVYKARQTKLDRLVAVKVLPQRLAGEPAFAERFEREGRLLARLNHPNIVGVYDFGQSDGLYYLVMEYVDGVNLRQALATGRFTPAQALSIIPKICDALQFAHEEGVLHRDIKPENILLDTRGRVKIADFGIAKFAGLDEHTGLTAAGTRLGTPHYMAPEQVERPADVDHRADIFSLGVVFYEMLTGELPLGKFAAPSERSQADSRIDEVVLRALEKDRERRQQSASEVRTQVESLSHATNQRRLTDRAAATASYANPQAGRANPSMLRSLTAFGLILISIPVPAAAGFFLPTLTPRDVAIVAFLAAWFGVPGTVLALTNLSAIKRTGNRRGLAIDLFSATFWLVVIISGCVFAGLVSVLVRYGPVLRTADYPLLIMPATILCVVLALAAMHLLRVRTLRGMTEPPLHVPSTPTSPGRIAGYCAAVVAWAGLGLATVGYATQRRALLPHNRLSSGPYSTAIDTSWELLSVDVKENVVSLEIQSAVLRSMPVRILYEGDALSPEAVELARSVESQYLSFPGKPFAPLTAPQPGSHIAYLAFAFPDHETALACKKELETRPRRQTPQSLGTLEIFRITSEEHGVYRASAKFGAYPTYPLPYAAGQSHYRATYEGTPQ